MRIAFLIQCHKNVEQINLLSRLLSADGDDVYIHLDRKNQADRENIYTNDHIFLLPLNHTASVEWAGFSLCVATMNLISEVTASGRTYDYIWLISGQDFPIRSMRFIKERLAANGKMPYIHVISREKIEELCFDKRNDIAHPSFVVGKKLYQKIARRLLYIITGGKKKTFAVFKKRRPVKELYYGSTWWCLPYDCVTDMMSLHANIDGYDEYFATSLCSDESFFQTLFMQTQYAGKQADILTYIDWSANECSPKQFTIEDYPRIKSLSDKYFLVRKVDMTTDRELVELLAKYVVDSAETPA